MNPAQGVQIYVPILINGDVRFISKLNKRTNNFPFTEMQHLSVRLWQPHLIFCYAHFLVQM